MDIAQAKEQIKNTVKIYLQKDPLGHYLLPVVHQRPVFLSGPPGVGKTAIMKQIAEEMNIGLVSYSMTHHTRQSAIGLPIIVEKEFDGQTYQVSEYTMSEIIASIYDCMRQTRFREGILFLDEINCVSETLSPSMLLFLQYKVFGGHQIPEGWIVVTAGNPPRFNKSAHEFDAATRDRLKVMTLEPDYSAWKNYALGHGLSRCIISYLDIRGSEFYKAVTNVGGMNVITPRTWEDLSEIIQYHENLKIPVTEDLVSQYLQDQETARDFSIYYQLYQKYKSIWQIEEILSGSWDEETLKKAREEKTDERITLTGLLLEAVYQSMTECTGRHDALAIALQSIKEHKADLQNEKNGMTALTELEKEWKSAAADYTGLKKNAALKLLEISAEWRRDLEAEESNATALDFLRNCYKGAVAELEGRIGDTQQQIGNLLKFLKEAFGRGMELGLAANDLSTVPEAAYFLGRFVSTEYFEESRDLLLHKQEDRLLEEIQIAF